MIVRQATGIILEKAQQYPVVCITGPRQSGKTTLVRSLFSHKPYVNLENVDLRHFAIDDPRGFLSQFITDGAILDEIQHAPELFSYLQARVDENKKMGEFILTGSQQFNLNEKITQSLAGRVGLIQLLPLTIQELKSANVLPEHLNELMFKGFYPPTYDRNIPPLSWFNDYVMTYLERDVRQLINVHDLRNFHRFLKMCAARTGQILNLSSLANDCGITHNTAKAWISVLVASYIIFLLEPHFKNYNKRLIKSPKLYFYDTGLVSFLNGIQNATQLEFHPARGQIFETMIVSELIKNCFNKGLPNNLYFWRDSQGHEIDVLIENGSMLTPIEIKVGQTISTHYFNNIVYWQKLSMQKQSAYLIYGGDESQKRSNIQILSWRNIPTLFNAFLSLNS